MIGFFIAVISGILMSVQGVMNTQVTGKTSLWVSNVWVQLTALCVCVVAWFLTGRASFEGLVTIRPKYLLLGGVIGAFITLTVMKSMSLLGPAKAVLFIVIAQMIAAYVIELTGALQSSQTQISVPKLFGLALAIAGVLVFELSGSTAVK